MAVDEAMQKLVRAWIVDGFVHFDPVPDEIRDRFIRLPDPVRSSSPLTESRRLERAFQISLSRDGIYQSVRLGSWSRLRRLLEAAGYRVDVEDRRAVREEFQPVGMETLDLDEASRAFLGAIRDRDRGLWVTAPGDRNRRIADVCRLYPKAPVVVVCQSHHEVRPIASALAADLGERVLRALRSGQIHYVDILKDQIPRIEVCTPAALSTNASSGLAIAVLADADVSGGAQ